MPFPFKNLNFKILCFLIISLTSKSLVAHSMQCTLSHGAATIIYKESGIEIVANHNSIIDFDNFSIERDQTIQILLPESSSKLLIKNSGSKASELFGKLISNGTVYLINVHGVHIHKDSHIECAGFTISTFSYISMDNFINDQELVFSGCSQAPIMHYGKIAAQFEDVLSGKKHGGDVRLIAKEIFLLDSAMIDVSGSFGGGNIYIGGSWKRPDPKFPWADFVMMDKGVEIKGDATVLGNGGSVVAWADKSTIFLAQLSVKGVGVEGRGGDVEIASNHYTFFDGYADLSSEYDEPGSLLVTPTGKGIPIASNRLVGNRNSLNIPSDISYKLQASIALPPVFFIGKLKKNKFLNKTEYILDSRWEASPSEDIVLYRIYKEGILVQEVLAIFPPVFETYLGVKQEAKLFSIAAVNSHGLESSQVPIRIVHD